MSGRHQDPLWTRSCSARLANFRYLDSSLNVGELASTLLGFAVPCKRDGANMIYRYHENEMFRAWERADGGKPRKA
jgi:hypothetical protein